METDPASSADGRPAFARECSMYTLALCRRADEFLHCLRNIAPDEMLSRPVAVERLPGAILGNAARARTMFTDHHHRKVPDLFLLTPHVRALPSITSSTTTVDRRAANPCTNEQFL